jgi:hypothetical protein
MQTTSRLVISVFSTFHSGSQISQKFGYALLQTPRSFSAIAFCFFEAFIVMEPHSPREGYIVLRLATETSSNTISSYDPLGKRKDSIGRVLTITIRHVAARRRLGMGYPVRICEHSQHRRCALLLHWLRYRSLVHPSIFFVGLEKRRGGDVCGCLRRDC